MKYDISMDNFTRGEWEQAAKEFVDYSIYQTWAYQQVRGEMDGQEISRFIIKDKNGCVVSMGQIRIKCIKMLGLKIGFIQSGPLVKSFNGTLRSGIESLKVLRTAYVGSRVNVLRVVPNQINDSIGQEAQSFLEYSGFIKNKNVSPYHTIMVSLKETDEDIFMRINRDCRRILRNAGKRVLDVREGTANEDFNILEQLYQCAKTRKGFKGLDSGQFAKTQQLLATDDKVRIIVAYIEGQPVTAHATSHFAKTAVPILTASNKMGLKCGASYLLWWRAFLVAKKLGMEYYDLGGVDPDVNPKGYLFKKRLGGVETHHIGAFDMYANKIIKKLGLWGEKYYNLLMK